MLQTYTTGWLNAASQARLPSLTLPLYHVTTAAFLMGRNRQKPPYIFLVFVQKVKVKWYSQHKVNSQEWWPILGICSLHLPIQVHTHRAVNTHTMNTHPEQWTAINAEAPGEQLRGLVPCSKAPQSWYWRWKRVLYYPHLQFLLARDSNSQPLDYESDSLTIRPRLPPTTLCGNTFVEYSSH